MTKLIVTPPPPHKYREEVAGEPHPSEQKALVLWVFVEVRFYWCKINKLIIVKQFSTVAWPLNSMFIYLYICLFKCH